MQIFFQDKSIETAATTLAGFLAEQKLSAENCIFELNGAILDLNADVNAVELCADDKLNAFRIVAGG